MEEVGDPCVPDGVTVWRVPQFEFGATLFTHGLPYPGGKSYLGGTLDRGALRGDEGGWRSMLEGTLGQVAIDANDPQVLYVAGPGLRLRKSSDGGRNFVEVTQGLADEGLLVSPLVADPNDNQRLWFGGRAVWRTSDGAQGWVQASAPVAGGTDVRVSALAVAAANSGYVLAGTSAGDIHRTFNSLNLTPGEQWPSVRPRAGFVSSLAFDPYNPNIAYATYSTMGGAHVWRSYDAGASWASLDGEGATALPDIPAHSLAIDPTNPARLYVGTDLGIFVSLDGGQSWAVEQAGFGTAIVESLAIGATDDGPALFAFTHGRGVWRVALQPCTYSISPTRSGFEAAGGTGGVNVTTTSACTWTARSNVTWVTINSGATGTGSGMVTYTVAANTAMTARTGTLTIAGQVFTVEQNGLGGACVTRPIASGQTINGVLVAGDCLSQQRTGSYADRFSFSAKARELVAITLGGNLDKYLYLIGPTGTVLAQTSSFSSAVRIPSGSGFFELPADGEYTIEVTTFSAGITGTYDLNFVLVPAGCGFYTLLPASQSFDAAGGEGRLQVATGSNCPWTAASNVPWVTITSGSGGGSLPVSYRVVANTGSYRTGTLAIAGQTFTIEQAGAGGDCLPVAFNVGQTVNGALGQADCRSRNRGIGSSSVYNADRYSFTAQAGQQLIVTASASFNPYLYLTTGSGAVLAEGETRLPLGGGSFAVPADGTYILEITTRDSSTTGTYSVTVSGLPPGCGYVVTPSSESFESNGGTGSIAVTTGANCVWTATTGASWITITNGSGSGNGMANYTVAANNTGAARTGTIIISGQTFTVLQAGAGGSCKVQPLIPNQPVNGNLSATDCTTGSRGSGTYYVDRYSFIARAGDMAAIVLGANFDSYLFLYGPDGRLLASNDDAPGGSRIPTSGNLTLPASGTYLIEVTSFSSGVTGSYTLTLDSLPSGCSYSVAPALLRFDPAGGTGAVAVTAPPGCAWIALSNASWLTVTSSASGTGNGTIRIEVAANTTTVLRRATLTIPGQTVTIEQAGVGGTCLPQPLTVNQPVTGSLTSADCQTTDRYSFTANAGEQLVALITANSFTPVVRLLDAQARVLATGSTRAPANGFVSVPANGTYFIEVGISSSSTTNTYTLTLFSVAANCSYALNPTAQTFEAAGGTGTVMVTAPDNCSWVAASNAPWLTITAGASGTGTGALTFAVAANTTSTLRTGTLSIGGRTFTVDQAGTGGSCLTQPLTLGAAAINGSLSAADCRSRIRLNNTFYADRYSFNFTAGQQFAVVFDSSTVTGYVYLTDQNGAVLAEGAGRQLRLPAANNFLTLPASGTYFIEVTSESSFSTGSYTLRLLAPAECAYSFLPSRQTAEANGGPSSFNLVTGSNCQWTATSNAPWLIVTTASGTGNSSVNFTVAANNTGTARTGTISVGSQSFTVEQASAGGSCGPQPITPNQTIAGNLSAADCLTRSRTSTGTYADRYSFTAQAGDLAAIVMVANFDSYLYLYGPDGKLIAQNDDATGGSRIPISGNLTLPASGTYLIEATSFSSNVTGNYTLTLFTLQGGCDYTLTPDRQAFEFAGGEGSFAVTAGANCAWMVFNSPSWVTLMTGGGPGSGTVRFTVALNATLTSRSATLQVGGRNFVIEQAGVGGSCLVLPITPGQLVTGALNSADCQSRIGTETTRRADRYSFSGTAGEQISLQSLTANFTPTLGIIAPDGSVLASLNGLKLPASGLLTLPATGTYVVEISAQFFSGQDAGYQLLLATTPGSCVYALNPSRQSFESSGGTGSVNVAAGSNCTWTAVSTAGWITLNSGSGSGTGNGAAAFTVAANTAATVRTGLVLIAGQVFTVEQAGAGGNCLAVPIVPGLLMGRFSDGDCASRVRSGTVADRYSFTATAGQQVLLTGASDQNSGVRPDIFLLDANGVVLAQALASFNTNSRLPASSGFFPLPGAGTYFVEVVPSNSGSSRGNYLLNLSLTSAGCSYAISPTARLFNSGAQTDSFNVITGTTCAWTAASDSSWITINSGATGSGGTGNGAVNFSLAANTTTSSRSGTIAVAGLSFTITQSGAGSACLPTPITPGQNVNGDLSTADCNSLTRVSSRADRYTFNGESGARLFVAATTQLSSLALILYGPDGAIVAQVDATRLPRAGAIILPASGVYTLEVASQSTGNYTLNLSLQAPCSYKVTPTEVTVEAGSVTGTVMVAAAGGCDWSTVGISDWISVPAAANFGSGNGPLRFNVAPNPGATPRTGTLVVAGQPITVKQLGRVALASAASFKTEELAPDSIAVAFGLGLATSTAVANTPVPPLTLLGTTVKVRDSAGTTRDAGLFAVSPGQINFLVPAGTALGEATVIITAGDGVVTTGTTLIAAVAPGLFAANADGRGLAAGVVLRVRDGVASYEPLLRLDPMTNRLVALPIDLGPAGDEVYLVLFGSGFRGRTALSAVTAQVGGVSATALYAGAQGDQAGLDQLNLLLPRALVGRGEANVMLSVDGKPANTVQVTIR